MTIMLDYEKLWTSGGYGKDNPLENTVAYIRKKAVEIGATEEIADLIINEVMVELAAGKQYPLDKCPCGCGIDKSGTAITHEMLGRLYSVNRTLQIQKKDLIERRHNAAILGHIKRENEEYLAEKLKPTMGSRLWESLTKKRTLFKSGEDKS